MGKRSQRFSIRKYSFGAASVLLGTALLAAGGVQVKAEDANSGAAAPSAVDDGSSAADQPAVPATNEGVSETDSIQTRVVGVDDNGTTVTTTSEVTSSGLEKAKAAAQEQGIQVEETPPQLQPSVEAAVADNNVQTQEINQTLNDYQVARAQYQAAVENYNKAKLEFDNKTAEKEKADQINAQNKAAYEQAMAVYKQAQADYEAALAQYNADKKKYDTDKANYDSKVAEKAEADRINAENEAKYQEALAAYNTAKAQYDADKAKYDQ
ncbi:YSIRK-type signal peptide-containing protein, partial [Streptococcus dentasini]